MTDPLAGSPWSRPETVAGFVNTPPNQDLLRFAAHALTHARTRRLLDLGCGAGRNALPLARQGWTVLGTDLSTPMLEACAARAAAEHLAHRVHVVLAPMEALPVARGSCDLIVAHGIWNLATSGDQFRRAVREAARVAAPGAGLFVFTFSRHTLSPETTPVAGESFVFTEFSGAPQVFLTEEQLVSELRAAGFDRHPAWPIEELNRRRPGAYAQGGPPVIYQAVFRAAGS
jgi:SAM-dependent methyltransferase